MAILNPRAQIPLVLAQIEREYSKGMEFFFRRFINSSKLYILFKLSNFFQSIKKQC